MCPCAYYSTRLLVYCVSQLLYFLIANIVELLFTHPHGLSTLLIIEERRCCSTSVNNVPTRFRDYLSIHNFQQKNKANQKKKGGKKKQLYLAVHDLEENILEE